MSHERPHSDLNVTGVTADTCNSSALHCAAWGRRIGRQKCVHGRFWVQFTVFPTIMVFYDVSGIFRISEGASECLRMPQDSAQNGLFSREILDQKWLIFTHFLKKMTKIEVPQDASRCLRMPQDSGGQICSFFRILAFLSIFGQIRLKTSKNAQICHFCP